MIVDQLLSGVRCVPCRVGCHISFVYVKNAAHAHVCAIKSVLRTGVQMSNRLGGATYNVTNGDVVGSGDAISFFDSLLEVCGARGRLVVVPVWLWLGLATMLEGCYALTCGRVPFKNHAVWNLTRAGVGYASTPITLDIADTRVELSYTPLFSSIASFSDIKRLRDGDRKNK